MYIRKILIRFAGVSAAAAVFAALAGCATPHVVDEIKISDRDLNCDALDSEIRKSREHWRTAENERESTTASVVFNGILFPPMFLFLPASIALDSASNSNIEEAKNAANKREAHLRDLYNKKKCNEKKARDAERTWPTKNSKEGE